MRDFNLGEFIESLGKSDNKEADTNCTVEVNKMIDELFDEIMASIKNDADETVKDFIECEKARNVTFLSCRERYHSSIEDRIERPLSTVKTNIVDTAFQFAFINGWLAHKKSGGNNDK